MAAVLVISDKAFLPTAPWLILFHLPNMVAEGIITMYLVKFIEKVQPEILDSTIRQPIVNSSLEFHG